MAQDHIVVTHARALLEKASPGVLVVEGDFRRDPGKIIDNVTEALASGSAVAISHITDEEVEPENGLAAQKVYQGASAPAVPRFREDIMRFFGGLELMDPGVTDINLWPARSIGPAAPLTFYGGVARKL